MNLIDLVMQAQGGNAIGNLAKQFGLENAQAEQAVKGLLPALSKGMKANADAGGLGNLLGMLKDGNHAQYADDADAMQKPEAIDAGNNILGQIFGSKDVSRKVASHVAKDSGVDEGILKKLLPDIASVAMGGLAKQVTGSSSMSSGVDSYIKKAAGSGGGLVGKLLGGGIITKLIGGWLLKRFMGGNRKARKSILGNLLDADGDGSWLDDVGGMVLKQVLKR